MHHTIKQESSDPLFLGTVVLSKEDAPQLTSGSSILADLEDRMRTGRLVDNVLTAPPEILEHFGNIFPEIVESNHVGKFQGDDVWKTWTNNNNEITVELDRNPRVGSDAEGRDVYIGGPAALFAAAIQSRSGEDSSNVLYGHEGRAGLSNWKGSASYYHIRDAIPVYYWPDNHGAYVLYATVKHALQKTFLPDYYKKQVDTDPNWNKLRFNLKPVLADPVGYAGLFMKNQLCALKDVGLHVEGTNLAKPVDTTAYTTTEHAFLTHEITEHIKTPRPMIMQNADEAKALHMHFKDDGFVETNKVFKRLASVAGDKVKHRKLTDEEMIERGYDPKFVRQALEFPNDGYIPPYVDGMLEEMVREGGGDTIGNMKLSRILVSPSENGDVKVTQVVWNNSLTGKECATPVKSLHLSLGPSMRNLKVVVPQNQGNPLTSQVRNWMDRLRPNMMKKIMWASGSSIVFMVKIDKTKIPASKMTKFRDHTDAHNKHVVRLGEKEVIIDGKPFQFFALQTTGGGNFPIKDAHAETALNVLNANVIPLLDLGSDGIEFDVITTRSCARGITGQNVFRMSAPASNMVMIYGVGGIGMTTMAPNALLMKAMLGLRQRLGSGQITGEEFNQKLAKSDFGTIPHWSGRNPFTRNYAQFVDAVRDPRTIARRMGLRRSQGERAGSSVVFPGVGPVINTVRNSMTANSAAKLMKLARLIK